ncbi:hypothetical protein ABZT06_49725 [Streptomyces sp. NPDC005483]|uniref:ATP-grasp domain-containing protein n=1 Tax=Streptomyces sp. NPDC005483 TaxID=3154882 RepID=UPI0033B94840
MLIVNGEVFQRSHTLDAGLGGNKVHFCGVEDLTFSVRTGQVRVCEAVSGRDLADFGLLQVAAYPRPTATLLSAVSAYLEHRKRPPVNAAGISAPTKLYQLLLLALKELPVPATVYLSRKLLDRSFGELAGQLGLPFVLKAINASGGRLNFLIETEIDFMRYVDDPAFAKVAFLAQEFIPNNGTFRALVLGDGVPIVMHRCSTNGSHLTNTEQGGHATLFDADTFDAEVLGVVREAARVMGYEVAGVNLVQHRQTREWYLLEVSSSPAIGSGAYAEAKTKAYSSYLRAKLAETSEV